MCESYLATIVVIEQREMKRHVAARSFRTSIKVLAVSPLYYTALKTPRLTNLFHSNSSQHLTLSSVETASNWLDWSPAFATIYWRDSITSYIRVSLLLASIRSASSLHSTTIGTMPSVTSRAASRKSSQSKQSDQPQPQNLLRPVSPEELESWSDGDSETTLSEPLPEDLDEPWSYTFHVSFVVFPHSTSMQYRSRTARRYGDV